MAGVQIALLHVVFSNDALILKCAVRTSDLLLTFYIADNALCGIKIVLQLIVAGAQIKAGLE